MTCAEIQNNLIDYGTSSLSEDVRAHLMGCVVCRKEAQAIEHVLVALKNDTLKDPGEAYWQTFSTRIEHRYKKEQRGDRIQKLWEGWKSLWHHGFSTPAFGVAFSILLVIGGTVLMTVRLLDKRTPSNLAQVLSVSKLPPDGVEIILSLGDDPYDMASDALFNTDTGVDIDI